jgi:hypothetical protein
MEKIGGYNNADHIISNELLSASKYVTITNYDITISPIRTNATIPLGGATSVTISLRMIIKQLPDIYIDLYEDATIARLVDITYAKVIKGTGQRDKEVKKDIGTIDQGDYIEAPIISIYNDFGALYEPVEVFTLLDEIFDFIYIKDTKHSNPRLFLCLEDIDIFKDNRELVNSTNWLYQATKIGKKHMIDITNQVGMCDIYIYSNGCIKLGNCNENMTDLPNRRNTIAENIKNYLQ